jgi:malonyl-CoA decarboxylase
MIEDLLFRVTDIGSTMLSNNQQQSLAEKCESLLSNTGEATSLALSREILDHYTTLSDDGKLDFFMTLASGFGVDIEALQHAYDLWKQNPVVHLARQIHFSSEPRSQELFRQLNRVPGGTATLVSMREDLLRLRGQDSGLKSLDKDLSHLFVSWFNRGFLRIEQINWSTPAKVLEKIIQYEAVHKINGWDDLRRRVAEADRRLYAFFHPALPSEPLIFVEVALTRSTPDTIESILSAQREPLDPKEATTAVFYSISNCQSGLRGISFGNFLIKQVVEELKRELPTLKTFITMSPVPSMRKWLETKAKLDEDTQTLLNKLDAQPRPFDEDFKVACHDELKALATHYLLDAKSSRGGPFDPVSRFHLGNGAHLEKINLWANSSDQGFNDSYQVMVNYEYDLKFIEKNHETFLTNGTIVTSPSIKKLHKKTQ